MKIFTLPWGAWYKETQKGIIFPDTWNIDVFGASEYEVFDSNQYKIHVDELVSAFSRKMKISEMRRGIGIGIDDLTRPTPVAEILTRIIEAFQTLGISAEKIHLFIAAGAHRTFQKQDFIKKIGKSAYQYCTLHHHSPYCNVSHLGETNLGTPVFVNQFFMEMDFKVAIGTVLPHSSVGFSGGSKLVVPGLAGIETIKALHRSSPERKGKFADITDNPLRMDIDDAGKLVGIDFFVQFVCNPNRTIAKIFSGEDLFIYQKAAEYLKEKASFLVRKSYDIAICNAYPLDSEFVQSGKALDVIRVTKNQIVKEGGIIILSTVASEGQGFHGLRSPGMIEPFLGDWTQPYGSRELIFFGENISLLMLSEETRKKAKVFNQWSNLLGYLKKKYGRAEVAVFPYAAIQIPIYQAND